MGCLRDGWITLMQQEIRGEQMRYIQQFLHTKGNIVQSHQRNLYACQWLNGSSILVFSIRPIDILRRRPGFSRLVRSLGQAARLHTTPTR